MGASFETLIPGTAFCMSGQIFVMEIVQQSMARRWLTGDYRRSDSLGNDFGTAMEL